MSAALPRRDKPARKVLGPPGLLKFLADTNVVVPLEPTKQADVAANTKPALGLAQRMSEHGHSLYVHPAIEADLARDQDEPRRLLRQLVVGRYPSLPCPPSVDEVEARLGVTHPSENDRVDHCLLAAVLGNAVHYLVTEDQGIHRKARRLGIDDRVLTVAAAVDFLRDLYDTTPRPPPHVQAVKAHRLNMLDPIFESFRTDYDNFDNWLAQAARQHRDAWVIDGPDGRHAAVAIVKCEEEDEVPPSLTGRTLKICTFKVSDTANGSKFGELLLKTIFDYAYENGYANLFLTVFPKHAVLVNLLRQFGFDREQMNARGEEVLTKRLHPERPADAEFAALPFHIRFGPRSVRSFSSEPCFVVPIKPAYHDALFPGASSQISLPLGEPKPFGCAIRKAYLCRAKTRQLTPGNNILFYRSKDAQHVACTGVLESTLVSVSPDEIANFVGTRTVYTYAEIVEMCERGAVLALLFRHSRTLVKPITSGDLHANSVLNGPPQTIVRVPETGLLWLEDRMRFTDDH